MPGSLGTPRYEALVQRLIDARNGAGLTQAQVARKLNKPQSFVAKYERGERRLDVIELLDVCQALSIHRDQILSGI